MSIRLSDGRLLSALRWGDGSPELVLLHGGAQNAHTWDTVALALGRPLLALDLPSQGHSDAARDGVHDPASLAADVAEAIGKAAPSAELLCGLSLGGLVLISLTAAQPHRLLEGIDCSLCVVGLLRAHPNVVPTNRIALQIACDTMLAIG